MDGFSHPSFFVVWKTQNFIRFCIVYHFIASYSTLIFQVSFLNQWHSFLYFFTFPQCPSEFSSAFLPIFCIFCCIIFRTSFQFLILISAKSRNFTLFFFYHCCKVKIMKYLKIELAFIFFLSYDKSRRRTLTFVSKLLRGAYHHVYPQQLFAGSL